jgi:hypothetical protein
MRADPRITSVSVGPCTLLLTLVHPDGRSGGRLVVQLPKPVRGFVDGFDAGRYPSVLRLQVGDGPAPGGPGGHAASCTDGPPPADPSPDATPVVTAAT